MMKALFQFSFIFRTELTASCPGVNKKESNLNISSSCHIVLMDLCLNKLHS